VRSCTAPRPGARFRRSGGSSGGGGGGGGMVKMLWPPRKTRRVRLGCVRARHSGWCIIILYVTRKW